MNLPNTQLIACNYEDIPSNTPVLNIDQVDYFVYILVDSDIMQRSVLYSVEEVTKDGCVPANPYAIGPDINCWLRGTFRLMNTSIGQHIYKLLFVDGATNATFAQYVSYIVQSEHQTKPYIYMNRNNSSDERCSECTKF